MSAPIPKNRSNRLGQLFFSLMNHRLYDAGLYRFVTGQIWRCPTQCLMDNYADNVSDNHLEIGVGSGYFLERTLCADIVRRLVISDLNRSCLAKSAARLELHEPQIRRHNILKPFTSLGASTPASIGPRFTSVGMNYVLHCIPGSIVKNQCIFRHIHSVLEEGGIFFGATLLRHDPGGGVASWLLMRLLNSVGIFNNAHHTLGELRAVMQSLFSSVEISMVGDAAIFRAVK